MGLSFLDDSRSYIIYRFCILENSYDQLNIFPILFPFKNLLITRFQDEKGIAPLRRKTVALIKHKGICKPPWLMCR